MAFVNETAFVKLELVAYRTVYDCGVPLVGLADQVMIAEVDVMVVTPAITGAPGASARVVKLAILEEVLPEILVAVIRK